MYTEINSGGTANAVLNFISIKKVLFLKHKYTKEPTLNHLQWKEARRPINLKLHSFSLILFFLHRSPFDQITEKSVQ